MTDHRSFPDAANGLPQSPMEAELWAAGCDIETARFVARQLDAQGYVLIRADDIGWPEIRAFQEQLNHGQGAREDAGGFLSGASWLCLGASLLIRLKTISKPPRVCCARLMRNANDHPHHQPRHSHAEPERREGKDMSEAPERIWTSQCGKTLVHDGMKRFETDVQYIRADHVDALIAAAYDAAARAAFRAGKSVHSGYRDENERIAQRIENELRLEVQAAIRGARKQSPQEALDALLKAEREKALREASRTVLRVTRDSLPDTENVLSPDRFDEGIDAAYSAIEALIERDATDG